MHVRKRSETVLRWIKWLLANEFMHMHSFLGPLLNHPSVPSEIRERLERRLDNGNRLMKIRVAIYVIMFPAVLGILAWMVVDALEQVVTGPFIEALRATLTIVLQIVSLLFIISGIALILVQRAILLVRVDAMVLAMEVVALGSKTGAPMPSSQIVKMKKPKD
jgi:hypothetical protein